MVAGHPLLKSERPTRPSLLKTKLCVCESDVAHLARALGKFRSLPQQLLIALPTTDFASAPSGFLKHRTAISGLAKESSVRIKLNPRESYKVSFGEFGLLTLLSLYILHAVLSCRFKCFSVRDSDIHQYRSRDLDNFRMAQYRTL
ncbi:hypothetical protein J6590_071480 [Homalodisca vitripennis]|nr:hypothetical protein J6590_071480 [Homalodisca vitripennis]